MKQIARLTCFISICLLFLIFALFSYPFLISQQARSRVYTRGTQLWARLLLRLIGIKVITHGLKPEYRNFHYLLVSNHLSYLDIAIIASVFPAIFVANREV
jgi:1-acyl-sn-glycerol-3-phosphate acyltransferase